MKKWIIKNKKLLITFGVISLITLLITVIEINLIASNTNDLQVYSTTGVISSDLKTVGILGLVNVGILTLWSFIFAFIMIKMIFPNQKTVQDAFFISELNFLKDMPAQLKRGLDRNE